MELTEHGEDKDSVTTNKVVHVNWRMITSAMEFAINKCRGLELDLNVSIWLLSVLKKLAE